VIALEPEFILPQDGVAKQDREQQAAKRWIRHNGQRFKSWQFTIKIENSCILFSSLDGLNSSSYA